MLFNSLEFLIFFAVVFTLYCVLSRRWQNRMLLVASYIFYGWAEPKFVVLMALTTIADYFIGIRIEDSPTSAASKRWLTVSLMLNLGLLGTFKYLGFASENVKAICEWLGISAHWQVIALLPPAGISFYTFHEISYVTDIYRKHIKAARSFEDFAVFISFFPQLVAGPIGRASWQMPQFQASRRMTYEGWSEGLALFVTGLFRKVVVADPMGALAKQVFEHPERCGRWTLLLGLYFFHSKSTPTLPATATWRAAWRDSWASASSRISSIRISRQTSPNSGGAGTSASRPGFATISTSRSAEIERERCAHTSIFF